MKKKVLITGGTGFIGRNVVDELISRGWEVHSLVFPPFAPEKEGLIQYEMNLMDTDAVNKFLKEHNFENLIHLAWYVGPKCHVHDLNLDWTLATLNLLKSFKENGGKRFAGAGTISEYEYKYGYLLEDETPTSPKTLYGESKNSIYKIASVYCKQNGIEFKWPRIFNLYGPAEKSQRLMPSVINSCLKGEDVKVSDCLKFQDYLHVKDTACGIVDVFESDIEGAVNICSGKPVQLRTIVEKIAELTNFKGKILWGAIPAAFGDEVVVGNNEKLKSIGWNQKYSLEEGLKETIDWWKEHNKGELLNV
ncbi:TPA: NAD(P)-dependent oxidoreductase [Candidatus Scatenecus faecavium]|uniref:NAD(P)-dependent oxidoreductase n=1 Tax=Candidatus Scatenecus faecavium TaxID=2840915 RepID=A0A9D1K5Y6_9BACT|nr:NAD(P)-dependent oxidoreductase [Candidatus Scatenecus faecavium]